MPHIEFSEAVMIVCVALFTAVTAVTDLRTHRIPNKLTLPVFVLGLLYQLGFHGLDGLLDASKAFGMGFGTLFVLWLVGGGGGGDAKLMGALSVWLGWKMTVWVLILSTLFVLFGTFGVILYSTVKRGVFKTKDKFLSNNPHDAGNPIAARQKRRIMTYAFPVALATWVVLLWVHLKP